MSRSWPWSIDISWPAEFSQKASNLSWYTQETTFVHSASSYSLYAICMLLANLNTIYIHSSSFLWRSSTACLPLGPLNIQIALSYRPISRVPSQKWLKHTVKVALLLSMIEEQKVQWILNKQVSIIQPLWVMMIQNRKLLSNAMHAYKNSLSRSECLKTSRGWLLNLQAKYLLNA